MIAGSLKAVARKAGIRRAWIANLRMRGERELLATTSQSRAPMQPRILCYHSVGTPQWGVNDVGPKLFRDQIEMALRLGFRFVPARKIACGEASAGDLAITFDDGLASVATNAAPILAEFAIPWTLFVVTEWAAGRHGFGQGVVLDWSGVESLAASGIEIGSHSVTHADFGSLEAGEALDELVQSRRLLEARLGIQVTSFAIPFGQSANWSGGAHELALRAGYEFIYAQSAGRRPNGTVPRTFVTRFDDGRLFKAALGGAFDDWEEWV